MGVVATEMNATPCQYREEMQSIHCAPMRWRCTAITPTQSANDRFERVRCVRVVRVDAVCVLFVYMELSVLFVRNKL